MCPVGICSGRISFAAASDCHGSAWSPRVAAAGGGGGPKIALLLPENHTPRYEAHDRPEFEEKVEELCGDCEVLYSNATQDASKQQSQAEAALTQGAEVLVLDAVDAGSAAAIVEKAKAQNVPVLSYDRLIENAEVDYYVSYDNEHVGELQAETLAKELKEDGSGERPDRDARRRPGRQQRRTLQRRRAYGLRNGRREDRQGVRHARNGRRPRPRTRCSRRSPRSATTGSTASRRQRRPGRRLRSPR